MTLASPWASPLSLWPLLASHGLTQSGIQDLRVTLAALPWPVSCLAVIVVVPAPGLFLGEGTLSCNAERGPPPSWHAETQL